MTPPVEQELNNGVPHSARIWNYWLGGKDNYEADRELGQRMAEMFPQIVDLSLIHISEPTRQPMISRMPSSA